MFFHRLLPLALMAASPAFADLTADLNALRSVDKEGKGNAEASKAWQSVGQAKADELPKLLAAMDGANPLAANWLRGALGAVEQRQTKSLPVPALEAFVKASKHSPEASATAF